MAAIVERIFNTNHMLKRVPAQGDIPPVSQLLERTIHIVWPAIMEAILMGMVTMVDTMMVGTLGTVSLSAVGLTNQPRFFSMCPLFALSGAVSALVARRVGERDRESANRIMHQSLLLASVITLTITVLCLSFTEPIIRFCGAEADTLPEGVLYFRIITAGLICNCITTIINAAQRGAGNTKIALRTNIASNVVNVIFNYLLIGGHLGFPKMGVAGAAIATVLGAFVGMVMAVISVCHQEGYLVLRPSRLFDWDKRNFVSLLNMGSGAFVEQICLRIGFFLFALIVAKLGTRDFAVHNICMNIMNFVFFFGEGFSIATVTLVGQSLGQKRPDLARIYAGICQRMGFMVSIGVAVTFFFFAPQIVDLFTNDPTIVADGTRILYLQIYCVLMQICMVIYCGCLRGAGDIRYVAWIGLLSVSIVRPIFAWVLCWQLGYGLFGAWIGFAADQTVRFLLSWLRFRAGRWTQIKL